MKKILMSVVVMVLSTITMTAQNAVGISDFKITAGETKTIAVELNNAAAFTAFQMDVQLPNGLTLVQQDDAPGVVLNEQRAGSSFVLTASNVADATRVVVYSSNNTAISGSNGTLFTMTVVASTALQEGTAEVKLTNVFFSDAEGKETELANATATATIASHFAASVNYGVGGFAMLNKAEAPAYGEALTLYIIPNDGYKLAQLLLNGNSVQVKNNIYEIPSVEQDLAFEVSFKESLVDTVEVVKVDTLEILKVDTLEVIKVDTLEVIKTDTLEVIKVDTLEVIKTVTDTIEIETIITDTIIVAEVTEVPVPEIDFSNGLATITCALQGASIYYTLDGTVPTMASDKYTAPIEISEDCTVMAIAVISSEAASYNITGTGIGGVADEVVSRQYFTEAGVEIEELGEGINIVVIKYASGKVETQKVIVRKK